MTEIAHGFRLLRGGRVPSRLNHRFMRAVRLAGLGGLLVAAAMLAYATTQGWL